MTKRWCLTCESPLNSLVKYNPLSLMTPFVSSSLVVSVVRYIARQYNISLDHYSSIFQCMHDTGSRPLPNCSPKSHMKLIDGVWKNTLTKVAHLVSRPLMFTHLATRWLVDDAEFVSFQWRREEASLRHGGKDQGAGFPLL